MSSLSSLDDLFEKAEQLRHVGVAFLPVQQSVVDLAQHTFSFLQTMNGFKDLENGTYDCGTFSRADAKTVRLQWSIDDQSKWKDEAETDKLLYVTAREKELVDLFWDAMSPDLRPVLSTYFGEEPVPITAQFIVGRQHRHTERHADFFSQNIVTLIMPVFEYTPEQASLYYWELGGAFHDYNDDDNALLQLWNSFTKKTYHYTLGEGIVFRGDVQHQTVPFSEPECGWGSATCRALFSIVVVAPEALQTEQDSDEILKHIQTTCGGLALPPIPPLGPSSADTQAEGSEDSDESNHDDIARTCLLS